MSPDLHPAAAAGRHTVSIHHVEHLLLGACARGLDGDVLLRRAGIAPLLRASPLSRVTQEQLARLVRLLQQRLRDELWGLCGTPVRIGTFAQVARLCIGCSTLGEALAVGLRQFRLSQPVLVPRLQLRSGTAVVSVGLAPLDHSPSAGGAYAQRVVAFFAYRMACWLVARPLPLLAVDYPRQAARIVEGELLFGAPVRNDRSRAAWHLESRWLDLPVVQDRTALDMLLRQAPASIIAKYRAPGSAAEATRRVLRQHLAAGLALPELADVARQLALDPRTLRRHLADEGQPYRRLRDALRRDLAVELLGREPLTLPQLAQRLGFSEASTFCRAFKQWTGMAPGAYRLARQQV
ncbi:MAG: AraC family transcriptional regulator ligand-binding domain-containing protein [Burkholderiaceae bacterium]|nr:AraC family transcriptional regulator ligand-binding domain-containing protein [Burkholderiaceae bacterium]